MEYLTLSIECDAIRVSIPSGTLSFSSNPPGADIYLIVGGIPTYTELQTPNTINLYPGSYDYILKLTGFDDYTGITVVYKNETTNVIADLIPKTIPTILPAVVIGAIPVLGLILATTVESTIPITTGILGGKAVLLKL